MGSFSGKISFLVMVCGLWPTPIFACSGPGYPPGLGPLSFRSQGPGQVLRLTPLPRGPEVLDDGAREFRAMLSVSSIYDTDPLYHINMDVADARVAVATGFGDCWELEMALDERAIVDAKLDQLTFVFHRLFGFSDSGHDSEASTTRVNFPTYGVALDSRDNGPFSRSVELTLRRLLLPRSAALPAVTLSLMMRRETLEHRGNEEPDTDLGVGFNLGQTAGANRLYANLNYIWFGANRYLGIPLKDHQFAAAFIYEWPRGENFSWLAQYLYTEGVMKELGALDDPSHEVHLGFKWRYRKATVEAALIENIIIYNNGPDYGFALGVKMPF